MSSSLHKNWFASYVAFIENSCGSRLFQNFICHDEKGVQADVLEDGGLSCAMYVSGILKMFDKVVALHGTVEATEKDMVQQDWGLVSLDEIKPGDVLIWEAQEKTGNHLHMGFYIGNEMAISNSSTEKIPVKHHFTFHGSRKIEKAYRAPWGKHLLSSTPASQEEWNEVEKYITDSIVKSDVVLDDTLKMCNDFGMPKHHVEPNHGKFLHILIKLMGAKKILEIGTLGGYSAIWMARALPKDGKLITLEYDWEDVDVARENIARAGLSDVIDVRLGRALELLPVIEKEGHAPFDVIFIDADKQHNPEYLAWALKLSRPGSLIIADNVVRNGAILNAESEDPSIQGVRKFFDALEKESRLCGTAIQTVSSKGYDGFSIAVVN